MKIKVIIIVFISVFTFSQVAFSLQYSFQPRVSATEEYTSNVFLSENNEKDDFITTVSAGFTAKGLGKNGELEVSYDPAYSFYKDYDENDGWSHDAQLSGFYNITRRTRFNISDTFLRTQDPLGEEDVLTLRDEDVTQAGDSTIRKSRRTYYTNTADARLTYRFGQDDLIYTGFVWGLLRNDDAQQENSDYYSPNIGFNYWFGPRLGIVTNAAYIKANFDQDSDFIGDGTSDFVNYAGLVRFAWRTSSHFSVFVQHDQLYRDFDSNDLGDNDYMVYAPSAGLRYLVDKGLNLRLGGGYFWQNIDGDSNEQGFFGNSQIDKTWQYERGSISLIGITGLGQNDFGAQNIGLERYAAIQGSTEYRFTRLISWNLSGRYRYSDVVGNADQDASDNTGKRVQRYFLRSGFKIEPLRYMTLELAYSFNKVNSENEADEYDEHRGLLKITLTPDKPYLSK